MLNEKDLSQALRGVPRLKLGHFPTPLDYLARASAEFDVDLWIKRDDCTGLGGGGNKVRKLEFLLAEALELKTDVLLTVGSEQSNHARLTAAAAARLGIGCELILTQPDVSPGPEYSSNGNILLSHMFGAKVRVLPRGQDSAPAMDAHASDLRAKGRSPYCIPLGGSNALGTLSYIAAVDELASQTSKQAAAFDYVVLASGSGGTQAGIALGAVLFGQTWKLYGVSVGRGADAQHDRVAAVAEDCRQHLSTHFGTEIGTNVEIEVHDGARGPGYGQPSTEMSAAVTKLAELEGILLDPVYTGKAFAGLAQLIERGSIPRGSKVLFWHTGGAPALFAYPNCFQGTGRRNDDTRS